MEKIKIDKFKLIGLLLAQRTTNANGQSAIDCGNLWQQFETESFKERIANKLSEEIYAVYFDYKSDHTKPFSYFIGCKVKPETETPKGMDSLLVPAAIYSKTIAKGKMTGCITDAWKDIWASKIDRAYNYDFEIYGERSKDWSNAEVEILVSIK